MPLYRIMLVVDSTVPMTEEQEKALLTNVVEAHECQDLAIVKLAFITNEPEYHV